MSHWVASSGIRWSYDFIDLSTTQHKAEVNTAFSSKEKGRDTGLPSIFGKEKAGKGGGEPILFLHGWGCSKNVWRQQFEHFSLGRTVLAVDLPGHGESSWQSVSLKNIARDLSGILEELNLKSVNIVASSLGGLVAIQFFSLYPQKVKRMVLVGALPKFVRGAHYPHGLELERIQDLSEQLRTDYPSIVQIFFRSLFTATERKSERYRWLQQFGSQEETPRQEALQEFLNVLQNEDLREIFQKVGVPVQFINGEEDYICSQSSAEALHKSMPGSRLEIFKRCGHFPFLTKPQEFNRVLENFLSDP